METQNANRSRIIGIRLTPRCGDHNEFKTTTSRKLSDYLRHVLFNGSITPSRTRNQSLDDFMAEVMQLRRELHAEITQPVIKKLHTCGTM